MTTDRATETIVERADIVIARDRIRGHIRTTPVVGRVRDRSGSTRRSP